VTLPELLRGVESGAPPNANAATLLESFGFVRLGHHRLDLHRGERTAIPEVVLGLSKSLEQLLEIVGYFVERSLPLLVTKIEGAKAAALCERFPRLEHDSTAGLLRLGSSVRAPHGRVAVVTAGSSDYAVGREAAGTLAFFGVEVSEAYDCGVAGLHRLLAEHTTLADADILIVVAGMEGALPSVVGGLFRQPIIAVPTSVGYGASFGGLAALLAMLNGCAPGITVVNIDNGFGAAAAATSMLAMAHRLRGRADPAASTGSA